MPVCLVCSAPGVLQDQQFLLRRGMTLGNRQLGRSQLGIIVFAGVIRAGRRIMTMPLLVIGIIRR
jgi:hypothetical protein